MSGATVGGIFRQSAPGHGCALSRPGRPESIRAPFFPESPTLSAVYVRGLQTLGSLRDLKLYALALLKRPES